MLPRDRPQAIVLATTFGLVSTDDGGKVWHWSCEAPNTPMIGGGQYSMGPPPSDRIFAKTDIGVAFSSNAACTWSLGGGALTSEPQATQPLPFDVFPDPSDPMRVFALAANAANPIASAYRSTDGGATYGGAIFASSEDGTLTGIESSASVPGTVYITLYQGPGIRPRLANSLDGGDTWNVVDLEPSLGAVVVSLAAVDPVDSRTLYIRIVSGAGAPEPYQGLAISRDGGQTWTIPLNVTKGTLSGFARLSDQTLLVVGQLASDSPSQSATPVLFRSEDGGMTFQSQTLAFHPAGLAQRDGIAYVATNDFVDGFALASSADSGRTWTQRLKFRDIHDIKGCVRSACLDTCNTLVGVVFPQEVCATASAASGCDVGGPVGPFGSALIGSGLALVGWALGRRRSLRRFRR